MEMTDFSQNIKFIKSEIVAILNYYEYHYLFGIKIAHIYNA